MRKSTPLFCALLLSLSARRAWIEIFGRISSVSSGLKSLSARRAWIEISIGPLMFNVQPSLSARRAWIEISCLNPVSHQYISSLSARRAWIEMFFSRSPFAMSRVALRKESVDRNIHTQHLSICVIGRSPQGERG